MSAPVGAGSLESKPEPTKRDLAPAAEEPVEQDPRKHAAVVRAECGESGGEAELDSSASPWEHRQLVEELSQYVDEDDALGGDGCVNRLKRGVQREAVNRPVRVG